ncbi:type II toxin-antitoxin system RelB family antitoxin [Dickeya fangzhongdai]|uniref:type II toxin-antitoxin system RelB family antitoxin n=1 Tax=Dickeya fangzhongdai TaxID=1778540 RepID=UPI0004F83E8B|nr:ribbon-helix-helix protein, CopG family [Dickeya fangzhongdai]AIR68286.1 helix-turn-helix protein, CopG [Dickeya fangzhongdai]AYH47856.1 CopG family transcriptional regulator [Dickeya fangzhongdai]KGT96232.1 helix-turn-helix protein, CopG [Dickeya fangzhongdai]
MGVMSVRLNDNASAQLDALAKATGRTRSFLAGQAIEEYLAREAWQIAEVEQAIKEADAGDFVAADEMDKLFQKLGATTHGN